MRLPSSLLQHTATIEPYDGAGAHGPIYGPPFEVACYVEDDRSTVRTPDDREITSAAKLWCQLDEPITPESRVTVDGRSTTVLTVNRRDGGGLPTPDHLEVTLR